VRKWCEALALILVWAAFIVLARFAVKKIFTPYDVIFLRLSFAALLALAIMAWRVRSGRKPFGGVPWHQMLFVGGSVGVGFTCLALLGFSMAPASHGAVLMPGTLPFSTAVLAAFVLGERIQGRKALGLACILAGVLCMAYQAFFAASVVALPANTWKGDVLFPMASFCWAMYVVFSRKWGIKPLDAAVIAPIVGFVLFAPFYLVLAPSNFAQASLTDITLHGLFQGWIAFMLSMWLFMRVMQSFGPVKTTMLTAWAPVLASLTAVPLLGEHLTPFVLLGLLGVSIGTMLGVSGARPAVPVPLDPNTSRS
jgi:drug/metabolite transporter (DMT)-like permease